MASCDCYLEWMLWSDTFWVTLKMLWLHSLSSFLYNCCADFTCVYVFSRCLQYILQLLFASFTLQRHWKVPLSTPCSRSHFLFWSPFWIWGCSSLCPSLVEVHQIMDLLLESIHYLSLVRSYKAWQEKAKQLVQLKHGFNNWGWLHCSWAQPSESSTC